MKPLKQFLIIASLLLLSNSIFCQAKKEEPALAGVYVTLPDFQAGKLSYDIDCAAEKQKIKLHDFFSKPYFDVYYKGEKHTLQKKEVYAYRNCNNKTFRFFNNEEYQLAESGKISIYLLEQAKAEGKAFVIVNVYYFSATPDGEIKSLILENLKKAFPENHKFHDALDQTFKGNIDVSDYDSFHKMYKVNHIYEMSLQ